MSAQKPVSPEGFDRSMSLASDPRHDPPLYPVATEPALWTQGCTCAAAWRDAAVNDDDINVLALVKGRERYIFLFEDTQRAEALRMLGRYASNPDLSFTWYDAAVLSQKVRLSSPVHKSLNRFSLPQPSDLDD